MKKGILSSLLTCGIVVSLVVSATGCTPAVKLLWKAGDERDKIVVISDLHLGIDDRYSEMIANRPLLVDFLKRVQNTKDVRELVIAGDFLDEWYLPVYYPVYTDQEQFYRQVIANNQVVVDALNKVADSGIKVVYVIGNHDMTLEAEILQQAIPKIVQVSDVQGLGAYYTGDDNDIVIEHGHRYDMLSAPDTVTNAELCGNDGTILPAGYFYARYAATWILEGRPTVAKDLPVVADVPDQSDTDQYDAYAYYSILKTVSEQMTPNEDLNALIFDMRTSGFDDAYSYLDFFPAEQTDGTISAPVLFRNIQRTWDERQDLNNVKVKNTFAEAVAGATSWLYYHDQARMQYIDNPDENVDIVVFGHTHGPIVRNASSGVYYINTGTWIDHNSEHPDVTRTFTVITVGDVNTAALYRFGDDGSLIDIGEGVSK